MQFKYSNCFFPVSLLFDFMVLCQGFFFPSLPLRSFWLKQQNAKNIAMKQLHKTSRKIKD